jgi:hypothetical protein
MQLIEAEDGNKTRFREIAEQYLVLPTRYEFSEDYEEDDEWCASFIFLIYICALFFSLDFFLCGQFLRSIKTWQVAHNVRVVVELRQNKAFFCIFIGWQRCRWLRWSLKLRLVRMFSDVFHQ